MANLSYNCWLSGTAVSKRPARLQRSHICSRSLASGLESVKSTVFAQSVSLTLRSSKSIDLVKLHLPKAFSLTPPTTFLHYARVFRPATSPLSPSVKFRRRRNRKEARSTHYPVFQPPFTTPTQLNPTQVTNSKWSDNTPSSTSSNYSPQSSARTTSGPKESRTESKKTGRRNCTRKLIV